VTLSQTAHCLAFTVATRITIPRSNTPEDQMHHLQNLPTALDNYPQIDYNAPSRTNVRLERAAMSIRLTAYTLAFRIARALALPKSRKCTATTVSGQPCKAWPSER
jgi:hypothetical protein